MSAVAADPTTSQTTTPADTGGTAADTRTAAPETSVAEKLYGKEAPASGEGEHETAPPADPKPDQPAAKDDAATRRAPETYEFEAPEGVVLGDAVLAKWAEIAQSLDLPQEDAQRVLSEVGPAIAQQQIEQAQAVVQGWVDEAKADREIGGERLPHAIALAETGIRAFFKADEIEFLKTTGFLNRVEVVRGFMKIGQSVRSDIPVRGERAAPEPLTMADRIYGKKG